MPWLCDFQHFGPSKDGDAPCHRCGHGLRSVRGGWRRCRRHLDPWRRRERRKRCADLSRNMTLWQTLTCKWISLWICKDADWQSLWNHSVYFCMIFCFPRFAAIVISCLEESGIVVSHWPKDRKIAAEEAQESTAWKTFNSNVGAWLGAVVAGGILWLSLGTGTGKLREALQMQQCESSAVAVSLC